MTVTVHEKRVIRACDSIRGTLGAGTQLDALEEALLDSKSGIAAIDIEYLAMRISGLQKAASRNWFSRLMGW